MKRIYILPLILFFSNLAFCQTHSSLTYQALADSLFEHHNYQHAATYYEKALKNSTQQGDIMLNIAKCFYKINKMKEAEVWYQKAEANHAVFSDADVYQYVNVLRMIEKRSDAQLLLLNLIKDDPEAFFAKEILEDLLNYKKYYKDSSTYKVSRLNINTPLSEFAPAFYKDGIVFSSAQPEHLIKKKYHYDNTYFLNLYYSAKINDNNFKKPVLFEDKFNARFHDGPATFYANGEKMILNRNQPVSTLGKKGSNFWHLGLYDGKYNSEKSDWQLSLLPFNDSSYTLAHPTITSDGNIMYFISDKPGGYGGTDIYKVTKTNGTWGEVINLGSGINTPGNEVFPFYINSTLYFASNGRGGLGGLDIFKCKQTVNGFSAPDNLGYPINTNLDDFAYITTPDEKSGYFSSARGGNDDLFSFNKSPELIDMLAHIYDGQTKDNLSNAEIQVSTDAGYTTMFSDDEGLIHFQLPAETNYIIVGSKDGKTGMHAGVASTDKDKLHVTHQISAYGDTTRVACVGTIKNASGIDQNPSEVTIKDEATGKVIARAIDKSLVSFSGVKGHSYSIEIKNEIGDTTVYKLKLNPNESKSKTWTMALKEEPKVMSMAAHIFRADNNQSLDNAQVKIITFAEADQEYLTDANGMVEFSLAKGAAYILMTDKGNLTGMYSGIAEPGMDKSAIVHQVPVQGDQNTLPVAILVTDHDGDVVSQVSAHVTDITTGKELPVSLNDGVLTFQAEHGKDYDVTIEKNHYQSVTQKVVIPTDAIAIEKINVTLLEKESKPYQMAARVFRASDKSPLIEAQVKIVTFSETDLELITNEEGIVEFTLNEGTPYIIMADKDGLSGINSGVVEPGSDKNSIIHPVPAEGDHKDQLAVFGIIADAAGEVLTNAQVIITEKSTSKKIPVQFHDGILTFYGDKGKDYVITVDNKDYHTASTQVSIPQSGKGVDDLIITLERNKPAPSTYAMAARVFKAADNTALAGAQVKIITFSDTDQDLVANDDGVAEFMLKEGTAYVVMGSKNGMTGMHSGIAEPGTDKNSVIHPVPAQGDPLPIITTLADANGKALADPKITIIEKSTGKNIPLNYKDGLLTFNGEKGKDYTVTVNQKDHREATSQLSIPLTDGEIEKFNITLEKNLSMYVMAARVFKLSDNTALAGAQVKVITFSETDKELVANNKGIVEFTLEEGTPYVIIGSKDGLMGSTSGVAIAGTDKNSVIHPVPAQGDPEKQLPVFGLIANTAGDVLIDSKVIVKEKLTGEKIPVQFHDGILTFFGEKGKDYIVTVDNTDYQTGSKQLSIPLSGTAVEDFIVTLEKNTPKVISYAMAARVFKASDNTALVGAQVKIITFSETDKELVANSKGIAEFTLDEGTPYVIMGSKDGFVGSTSGIVGPGSDKATIIHPVPTQGDPKKQLPVFGLIADIAGEVLTDSKVIVKEKATGEEIPVQFHDGILTFFAQKGEDYVVTVDNKDYQTTSKQLSIPSSGNTVEDFIITLEKSPASDKNTITALEKNSSIPVSYLMAARAFKASDSTALVGAQIKVITFSETDQELIANNEGVVEFTLPESTAYIITATKDDLTGMHSGIAEQGMDKASITHPIPMHSDVARAVPLLGFISTANGKYLSAPIINITDETTAKKIEFTNVMGIVAFVGEKGHTYSVQASANGFPNQTKSIKVDTGASGPIKWQWKLTEGLEDLSDRLVLFNNLTEAKRCFLIKNKRTLEVIEKEGMLYLKSATETILVCNGTLAALLADPRVFVNELGIKSTGVVHIENIYFDFDKASLDETDEKELNKIAALLQDNADWELQISTHADDRGRENYNQRLSEKRAIAVLKYLNGKNVAQKRLISEAHGEALPAVTCVTANCSEEDHQKNRRAEFNLLLKEKSSKNIIGNNSARTKNISNTSASNSNALSPSYRYLDSLGNKKIEGVVFKINIGAYRYNSSLEFPYLKELGIVESKTIDGVTYYSLSGFPTLNKAEEVRKKVIEKGVTDASISIYNNDKKITLKEFMLL